MAFVLPKPTRWFQTWWGVVLLGLGTLVIFFIAIIAVMTVRFWWALKHGQTVTAPVALSGTGFTDTAAAGAPDQNQVDRAAVEAGSNPILGTIAAPVTIVEFFDYKCPYSKQAAPIVQQLAADDPSKVKIIVRDFPAESIHPGTTDLARVAYCAKQQGKYWQMNQLLFAEQDTLSNPLSDSDLASLASRAGVDLTALQNCLADPAALAAVTKDYLAGIQAGVRGTPTFFVNGQKVEGVIPLSLWQGYLKNF